MLSYLFPKHPNRRRIKIGAIAKDEAPYLIDWVFHHFYFGFDEIEIRINNTSDNSVAVLQALQTVYGEKLRWQVDDDLLEQCQKKGKSFQKAAYAEMLNRARGDFSHLLFIDIDEFWTPADLTTDIHRFVTSFGRPDDVGAIAFRWFYDAPDASTPAFAPLFSRATTLFRDPHVKTLYSLAHRPHGVMCHGGFLRSGQHYLASGARFDETSSDQQQVHRSVISKTQMAQYGDNLDRAFVLHRAHRSETEYLASLLRNRPYRGRTHEDVPLKTNRNGFVQTRENRLDFTPPTDALAEYSKAREELLARLPARLIREAKQSAMRRAAQLIRMLTEQPVLLKEYAYLFEGVSREPICSTIEAINREHVHGHIDEVSRERDQIHVRGWFYQHQAPLPTELFQLNGQAPTAISVEPRPDVCNAHAAAPVDCGVVLHFAAPIDETETPTLTAGEQPFLLTDLAPKPARRWMFARSA